MRERERASERERESARARERERDRERERGRERERQREREIGRESEGGREGQRERERERESGPNKMISIIRRMQHTKQFENLLVPLLATHGIASHRPASGEVGPPDIPASEYTV